MRWFLDSRQDDTRPINPREAREMRAIVRHFGRDGDLTKVYAVVEGQLGVLHARAQSLIQIAGVVITVTGFSGRIIADTNDTAQALIIAGVFLVTLAAAFALVFVMPIRWVSSYLHLTHKRWIVVALRRRRRKNIAFRIATGMLVLGMLLYILSIGIMLANPEMTELNLVR